MKTSEKVKKGIAHCIEIRACIECPYDGRDFPRCFERIGKDALAYIQSLEARLVEANKTSDDLRAKLAEYEKPLAPLPEV